jgi:hypothetical protein
MKNGPLRYAILSLWMLLGLALILAPWSDYWETNYFLFQYPELAMWMKNLFMRGAISGLGFMNVVMSLEAFRHRAAAVASRI